MQTLDVGGGRELVILWDAGNGELVVWLELFLVSCNTKSHST